MSKKYKNLMSPLKIRNFVLKNRMEASNSLPHFLQGPETYPADSVIAHYENKAKGAAITTCMGINNFTIGKQFPMDMDFGHFPDYDLYDCNSQNYLMQLADSIHYYDSIACMAIFVGPPSFYPLIKKKKVDENVEYDYGNGKVSAPPMEEFEIEKIFAHGEPVEYDEKTLDKICDSYAEQAWILQMLGYEMVSIHYCYGGNLPSRFMSPHTNKRTDKFGGSLENRMRFPLMVLERVRNKVGNNFLIEIEWSAEDLPGGYTLDDTVTFLNKAKEYIDIVQLRASSVDPAHPTGFNLEETPFLHYSEYVKKRVEGLVVGTIGGYHYVDTCEKVIAEGKADLISMARAWISNPNYFELVKEGRGDDVVPCLRCNKCHGRGEKDPFVSVCSVNPIIGLEHKIQRMIEPVKRKKKVAIIGGGPGGMRCALYLKERGHEVVIYEAGDKLGGAIKHSDYVSFKWPLRHFKDFLISQVEKNEIAVKINTKATPEMIERENYDVIITALGAVSVKPSIPGIDRDNVFFPEKAFMDSDILGKNVVVIGGGEVGVESAMHLCEKGHNVTVLEMRDRLAADSTKIHYSEMFKAAWEALPNFKSVVNATVTEVKDGEVVYKDENGIEFSILCDSVVVSAGMKSLTDEALKFAGISDEFYMIGDCKKPATIQQAMRSAFSTAMRI
ncbi:FAD-dependent oxidoreductase [Clostridium sp. SHJSY1]|uniref:FAD-dependent oxidoreductase n=1 Tax=Clostridium sp. SHJSY1 TaxID=2942483 RepID=UPI0028744F68|nr:FAD-dependent oxidoreductase [Clostridium sp. SHJSY1]MDS0526015.1 FAD-dependent oxidoreductase [Clostridium sp. SHJSY1]